MDTFQLGEVIVEREFESHDIDGKVYPVRLRIGKPQQKATVGWDCPFQILGVGDEKVLPVSGVDSFHVLLLTFQVAQTTLNYFARHEQKTITWLGKDNLGFPIRSSE